MKSNSTKVFRQIILGATILNFVPPAYAADPIIHVQWDGGGTPFEGQDYIISTDSPASPEFPDVKLKTGHLDWRVWSTDADNAADGYVGDIGVVSCPASQNFGVKLLNTSDAAGVRHVKGIHLVPTDLNNYSNITQGSAISGNLIGPLQLQRSSSGNGGTSSLTIGGNAEGDITVSTISSLSIGGDLSGNLTAVEIAGAMTIGGDMLATDFEVQQLSGSLTIDGASAGSLWILNSSSGNVSVTTVTGLIELNEEPGGTYSGTATVGGVGAGGLVATLMGSLSGTIHVTGDVSAQGSIGMMAYGSATGLTQTGLIQIDGDLAGWVQASGNAEGDIAIGGDVASTGQVAVRGDILGSIAVSGNVDGEIIANADGIGGGSITGPLNINGSFGGNICGDNLQGWPQTALPSNIQIAQFGPQGRICEAYVCAGTLQAEPNAVDKNRYLSIVVPEAQAELPTAIQVTLTSLMHPDPPNLSQYPPPDFSAFEGEVRWVGAVGDCVESAAPPATFACAPLQCTPLYTTWPGSGTVIHVYGAEIVPSSTYQVQRVNSSESCSYLISGNLCCPISTPMTLATQRWGDLVPPFQLPSPNPLSQPNIADIGAMQDKFMNSSGAIIIARGDLVPNDPNNNVNIADISACIDGFKNIQYVFHGPCSCSSQPTCPELDECNRCAP